MRFAAAWLLLAVALTLFVPGAGAQAAEPDPDTIAACEAASDIAAFDAVCPITVALHLRSLVGDNAELYVWIYFAVVAVAVAVWILVLLWRLAPRRLIRLKTQDKVVEVSAGNRATYAIAVENRRKRRPLDVEVSLTQPPKDWTATMRVERALPSGFVELLGEDESMRIPLAARKVGGHEAHLLVTVTSPRSAEAEDWCELDISAIPYLRDEPKVRRGKEARFVTLIKERSARAAISRVHHEPAGFRLNDDVTTTVFVANKGDDASAPMSVSLSVNGEELGREVVTIPAGGEACIEFPWIATSAESRVKVSVADAE